MAARLKNERLKSEGLKGGSVKNEGLKDRRTIGVVVRKMEEVEINQDKIRIVKEITHCTVCNKKVGKSSPTYDSAWVIFRKVMI